MTTIVREAQRRSRQRKRISQSMTAWGYGSPPPRGRRWSGLPRICLTLGLALALSSAALAQSPYPNRPVKILVGFTPGTAPDLAARMLADRFAEVWGMPFVVENVPGAGSNVAPERVAKAAADGYTLLMGGNSALVINPSLYET